MERLVRTTGWLSTCLVIAACESSTTPPAKRIVPAPHGTDSVFYVGARVPLYSLMRTESGLAYSPTSTTRARIVDGTPKTIQLTGDSLYALNPGAIVVEVRDDAAGWVTTFRVGSVYDLRRQWRFESLCRTATGTGAVDYYTNTLTDFVSSAPATIISSPTFDGRPHWAADGRPIVAAAVTGVSTDSVFHWYLHSNNHVSPDTAVITTSVESIITADSSMSIQYTSPNGRSAALQPDGIMSWSTQSAPICSSTSTGSLYAFRARLDTL